MELTIVTAKRKINWEPAIEEPAPLPPPPVKPPSPVQTVTTAKKTVAFQTETKVPRQYKKRVGNGHKKVKVRDLYDNERDIMRYKLFLPKNGQISDDDCVTFKAQHLPAEVAIFQVTGFISVLHTEVAEGKTQVDDLVAYENWMRVKYGGTLWLRYNLPRYVKVRSLNMDLVAQGKQPTLKVEKEKPAQISLTPKFTAFAKKRYG